MKFFKSRSGAAAVLILVVLFSTVFGAHRSLTAEAYKVTAQNQTVMKDLQTRAGLGSNLYTVAGRYLPENDNNLDALKANLTVLSADVTDLMAQADLNATAKSLLMQLERESLSDQDAKYVQSFQAQLESIDFTLAHDPYTAAAGTFNSVTLGTFPANLLKHVAGVEDLPIYR